MRPFVKTFTRVAVLATVATAAAVSAPGLAAAQTAISDTEIIQGLSAVTTDDPGITAALLKQMARQSADSGSPASGGASALVSKLNSLAQITVQIQFALDSDIIEPRSYAALGSIADALHHPILRGYRFLVVGNTDASGTRAHNLQLSQERADAIVTALTSVFGVNPNLLEAVGLGQEALQDPAHPDAAVNRRVQIYNVGSARP